MGRGLASHLPLPLACPSPAPRLPLACPSPEQVWPTSQLLVLRAEDMFLDAVGVMKRVQDFLHLPRAIPTARMQKVANRNSHSVKATPSRRVNATLDAFFAPYNAQLYAWMEVQGRAFTKWD